MTLYPPVPPWLVESPDEFLTSGERTQLEVLFNRIWPKDPARSILGAVEVGAVRFVSLLLARTADTFRDIPKWRVLYREGLKALDSFTQMKYAKALVNLADGEADALLAGLEAQSLTDLTLPQGATQYGFFDTLRRHCIQGCLSDPRWGGNTDRRMWRALGFMQPPENL